VSPRPLGLLLATAAILLVGAPSALAEEMDPYIIVLKDSVNHPEVVARRHEANRGARLGPIYRSALKGYAAELEPAEARAVASDPTVAYVEHDAWGSVDAQSTPTAVKRVFASSNLALDIDEVDDARVDADVAVLDSGLDTAHKDLYVTSIVDCTGTKCEEGKGVDKYGHGTGVAGLLGAIDNNFGITGVAPGVRLWSVKVVQDNGEGSISQYIAGIDWVTKYAESIEVANSSLGFGEIKKSEALATALDKSVKAGVVHVVSAGNEKKDASERVPANEPDVITVSAIADYDGAPGELAAALWEPGCTASKVGKNDELVGADDTSYTWSNFGTLVEVAAPGVCILTTAVGDKYKLESGTSVAAPQVSGAAAVLASLSNPNTKKDVETIGFTIIKNGNKLDWKDTSGDAAQEPLLEMSNEEVFKLE
jgi:subtilisin family serine protease